MHGWFKSVWAQEVHGSGKTRMAQTFRSPVRAINGPVREHGRGQPGQQHRDREHHHPRPQPEQSEQPQEQQQACGSLRATTTVLDLGLQREVTVEYDTTMTNWDTVDLTCGPHGLPRPVCQGE